MPRLAEVYDVIELYRPSVTEEKKRLVAAQNLKEVWTYSAMDSARDRLLSLVSK